MSAIKRIICLLLVLILTFGLVPATFAANELAITVALIDSSTKDKVNVSVSVPAGLSSSDGKLYLFAVPAYADGISGYTPVASAELAEGTNVSLSAPLNNGTVSSLLYCKFYAAVKDGSGYSAVSNAYHITNPEVVSPASAPRTQTASKKGIHMTMSIPTDLEELGISHSYFGIVFEDFISNTPTSITYEYNGKTYYFTDTVKNYDIFISNMTRAGISVTLTLHNRYKAGYEYLVHPDAYQRAGTADYAVNTSDAKGLETVAAAAHFLAERYNGNSGFGKVDNWIIGNEVNDNLQYNFMGEKNIDDYIREYLQSFRVLYTAIKSGCGNANVYTCLQHRWNVGNSTGDYSGKDFLDKFSACAKAEGDIDWGLSYHPYSFPMTDPDILNDGDAYFDENDNLITGGEVKNNIATPIITMKNLYLLTDYFHTPALLNPKGQVRSIILGEQGYTSYSALYGSNQAKQSANVALSYYIAEMNDDIDAYLLRTLTDEAEGNSYFRFGLRNQRSDGYPSDAKHGWEVYKYIDTADSLEYSEFAKSVLNISDWSEAVRNWDPSRFAAMGRRSETALGTATGCTANVTVASKLLGEWETGYNVFSFSEFDYTTHRPDGVALAVPSAYYMDYQCIEKHFETPLNLSSSDYLCLDVCFTPKDASGAADQLELKVRLRSGNDILDASGIIDVNKNYTLWLDIKGWSGRNSIDCIEVLDREVGKTKSFDGLFTVYNVRGASAVSGAQTLPGLEKTLTDISSAELIYEKEFDYVGTPHKPEVTVKHAGKTLQQHIDYDLIYHDNVNAGEAAIVVVGIGDYTGYVCGSFTIHGGYPTVYKGIDYAPVYTYSYYKQNNPQAVIEVGNDPEALLEHFVTKGMQYALQGIGSFNVLAYAKINGDLRGAMGNDWVKYYMHYLNYGIGEGRPISGVKPDDMSAPQYPAVECTHAGGTEIKNAKPANCKETGYSGDVHCDRCGEMLEKGKDLPKGSHVWNADSCTKPKTCTLCGAKGPTGHSYDDNVDGTCNVCGVNRENVEKRQVTHMFRMYNPNTGEHFYTGSEVEKANLVAAGWHYEGVGFTFPANTGDPVYRLFEPATGEHLYTMDKAEKEMLEAKGWNFEGIAFNSAYDTEAVQHRLYNPNATVGAYHFTFSEVEKQNLIDAGWRYQGIGWYSCWK